MTNRVPQLTGSDVKAWRRLVAEAEAAGCGSATLGNLALAARSARRCVVPGVLSKANPFVRLQRASDQFVEAKPGQRLDLAADLAALVCECRGLLDALAPRSGGADPPPDPPARFRADIDG